MRKKLLALSLTLAMAFSLTGCVKVVKIGEEAQLTGKQEFNATDSVQGMWESAEANIEEKAVDLPAFLGEAGGDLKSLVDKYSKYYMGTSGSNS